MTSNLYVSTACLPGMQAIGSRIAEYRRHGLLNVELGAGIHVDSDITTLLSGFEGRFLIHNYFPPPADSFVLNLASGNKNIRQRSINMVSAALGLSARLGAPYYSVHAGFITEPVGVGKDGFVFPMPKGTNEAQYAMERFINSISGLMDRAKNLGVTILVENNVCTVAAKGKLILQTADEFLELFRALPNPQLGLLLDTGHLNVSAHTLGFNRFDFIDQVTPYIRAFHIHDNNGMADTHSVISPGNWVIDLLHRSESAGLPIVIESRFKDVSSLQQHVNWLTKELM